MQASQFLNEPSRFSLPERELRQYRNYQDDGEFSRALDEVAMIATKYGCKSGFWRRLKKPALQMELHEKAQEFEKRF